MTLQRATGIALNPGVHTSRTCRAAERFILRKFLQPHERSAYAMATSNVPNIGASCGYPHWPFLRSLLARAYT